MFTLEHFKGNKIYLAKERERKKNRKEKESQEQIHLSESFICIENK